MNPRNEKFNFHQQADGSLVCPHRDLSVCRACMAADPNLLDIVGAVFLVPLGEVRDAFLADVRSQRDESEPCEAGTEGCSVLHAYEKGGCQTW
jgi:hypothetical protein